MRLALLLMVLALVPSCRRDVDARPREEPGPLAASGPGAAAPSAAHDEAEHETIPKRARVTKQVQADARIRTVTVAREVLAPTLALPGEVAADPDRSARVSSPVAGRLVDVRFKEGSAVKKGDVLAVLRIPEIGKVRAAHSATTAKSASARANAERLEGLVDKGMAARQEAVAARAEADALEAEAKALGEQLGALGMGAGGAGSELVLRAPVAGVVVARDAIVGQPVTTEQTIASIADLAEAWFLARVFEKDLGRLEVGAASDVTLNAFPSEAFEGKVEYIGRQIDPVARTVTARIRLANRADMLRIGLFGAARVVAKGERAGEPVLVVPRAGLVEVAGKTGVFVRVAEEEFDFHEVTTGEAAAGKVRVLSGLREGEDVVVDGGFSLKSVLLRGALAGED